MTFIYKIHKCLFSDSFWYPDQHFSICLHFQPNGPPFGIYHIYRDRSLFFSLAPANFDPAYHLITSFLSCKHNISQKRISLCKI